MKDIPLHAQVICTDGEAGKTSAIILNPTTSTISHLVVEVRKYADYLVPLEKVAATTPDKVQLDCTLEELHAMQPFTRTHYVQEDVYDDPDYEGTQYLAPYVTAVRAAGGPVEDESTPPGELAVHRGTDVYATDGHVGVLEEFVIEPESGRVTHLVLRKGHLWGRRDMVIPVSAIDRSAYDSLYLKLAKDEIAELPGVTVQRNYRGQGQD